MNKIWLLTIPSNDWTLFESLPDTISYLKGQKEIGNDTGYEHWQIICYFKRTQRLSLVKRIFGTTCHAEPSRSAAADAYVWKDDTSVPGTRFELGTKPLKRNSKTDWDAVLQSAKSGKLDDVPSDVLVRCYANLRRIRADFAEPLAQVREVIVYWGKTGVGKSRRAWDECGLDAYPKDPRTKFWDGYNDHAMVVVDEFRGGIDISHILRWTDRYPVLVEVKGSSVVFRASKIVFTSNLHPKDWYPLLDADTFHALCRRLQIIEIQ